MASGPKMISVKRDDSALWYRVGFDNGFEGTYPYVWLRDNCHCPQCYHPTSCQRFMLMAELDPDVTPASEALADDGKVLSVTWPDQHRSDFDAAWLNRQRFSEIEKDAVNHPELHVWGAELSGNIPTFDFKKILEEDLELHNWLNALDTVGLAVVKGLPKEKGALRQVANRVAYLMTTTNGMEFQVFDQPDSCCTAFTARALGLHVDMPYRTSMPGIQMLHCISMTADVEGGQNQFSDGIRVAQQIKKEFPEAYQLLTKEGLDLRVLGSDYVDKFHIKSKMPLIQCDENDVVQRINCCDLMRAPYMTLPVDKVTEMYRALKLFNEVSYRPENMVCRQPAESEMVTFNNMRILHARSGYTIKGSGNRHLEGGYLDWDEARSRLRVLREKLFGEQHL